MMEQYVPPPQDMTVRSDAKSSSMIQQSQKSSSISNPVSNQENIPPEYEDLPSKGSTPMSQA